MTAHTPGLLSQPGTAAAVYDFMVNSCRIDPLVASSEARLIAAAPELLAVLKDMTDLAAGPPAGVSLQQKKDIVARARAAIAKAEGRA